MSEISFARILACVRESQALSKAALARAAGIDPAVITRLEQGLRPTPDVVQTLNDVLGVDLTSQEVRAAVSILSAGGIRVARDMQVLNG